MNDSRPLLRARVVAGALVVAALLLGALVWPTLRVQRNSGRARIRVVARIVNNLNMLQAAKQAWALDHGRTGAVLVTEQDLAPYVKNLADALRPAVGERYKLNLLSETPEAELTRKWGNCPEGTRFRLNATNLYDVILPNKPHSANSRHGTQPQFGCLGGGGCS
jgi:hypothetical protein